MMAETAVSHIQLLKIDVQKSEHDVLLGIEEADWPKIEQIVIEVHDIGGQLSTIRQLLAGEGVSRGRGARCAVRRFGHI
jgi:hypothetical protein